MSRDIVSRENVAFDDVGPPRYEQLAGFIESAIEDGRIKPGDRLATVRQMADDLGVSTTTITAAFSLLRDRGLIRPEVGRGTFVSERPLQPPQTIPVRAAGSTVFPFSRRDKVAWRRRALTSSSTRLRTTFPQASDCSTGRPDVSLLPFEILKSAWKSAMDNSSPADLQYAGPEPVAPLSLALARVLERDGIEAGARNLVVGSSGQQMMTLCLDIVADLWRDDKPLVAVEEPGYPTIIDTYERAGAKLTGLTVDEYGAVPESLNTALRAGARLVLLTPRGHNPTGASWSVERRSAIGDVLASYPESIVIEDDQVADIASTRPGSLLNDKRVADRVVYIRSFSKSIGPDLRIAVAAARPRLRDLLMEAKSFADGWTSRLLQRTLADVLIDPELSMSLDHARDAYRKRRQAAAEALNAILRSNDSGTWCGPDGVNLWVHLPPGVDAARVVEKAAALGVLVAEGEAFFLRPGRHDVVRLNAGSVPTEIAHRCGRLLAEAALEPAHLVSEGLIYV